LKTWIDRRLKGYRFICVSNREPYIHNRTPEGIRCMEPASGVVTALDPVLKATGGTWIAHGSGSADPETSDARGRLRVPPGREAYELRRLWLSPEEEEGYYYGFANGALWPLCHIAYHRPTFEEADWIRYVAVNRRFADAVIQEAGDDKVMIFVQDYHLTLLPRMVKERLPDACVFQFWHIPWPNPEAFRICPWKQEILQGLLANDLLAFHIPYHCQNFLETIDREIESRIDRERSIVYFRNSPTRIQPHPISVDLASLSAEAASPETRDRVERLRQELGLKGQKVILGVDRLDYTKGILERLRAIDRLFVHHPELAGRTMFLQIGVPSRSHIPSYRAFQEEVAKTADEVNRRHARDGWKPVCFVPEHRERADLLALYRLADVCLVSSLHDGMNLVAKEFVAARRDLRGALVLSRFTGAARELDAALQINPYAVDECAATIHEALLMPVQEQHARMELLRQVLAEHTIFDWVQKLLEQAMRLEPSSLGNP
jgi:trehalose 6-phosphate synthase